MKSETEKRTPQRPPKLTRSGIELRPNENRFGSMEVEITDVRVAIDYQCDRAIESPIFSVTISTEDGDIYFDTSTKAMNVVLSQIQGSGEIALEIDRLDLNAGRYFIDVGVYERDWAYAYDYHWHAYPFEVRSHSAAKGKLCPPCHWKLPENADVIPE